MELAESILWERLDRPGHEFARLSRKSEGPVLEGCAVFEHEGEPCRLDYSVVLNERFETVRGRVRGWIGARTVETEIAVDAGRWSMNGSDCPEVKGALDLDLNFSPSTNLLPIRRLDLALGQEGAVRAAWLRFPQLDLKPLEQTYRRLGASRYLYRSEGGFSAELEVRPSGFVTLYPGFARGPTA
jgi:hypothetical protein